MSKFLRRLVASFLMVLGSLGSFIGMGQVKAPPQEKKEPQRVKVDADSPIYLHHSAMDPGYALTVDKNDAAGSKPTIVHWNHWSHDNHNSHGNHWSHNSHWNGW